MLVYAALTAPFALSLGVNIYLVLALRRARRHPAPKPSIEASDLLHDLTRRGAAIVKIEVIDASQLFLRSPRG